MRGRTKKGSQHKMVMIDQIRTQNPVPSFKPQKFVFNDSDDEEQIRHTAHSSFYNKRSSNIEPASNSSRRRPVSRQIAGTTGNMRPSLMNGADESYDDIIQLTSASTVVRRNQSHRDKGQRGTVPDLKDNNFIEELVDRKMKKREKREIRTQLRRFQHVEFNIDDDEEETKPSGQSQSIVVPKEARTIKQEMEEEFTRPPKVQKTEIKAPKIQVSALYFQMSEDEDKKEAPAQQQPNRQQQLPRIVQAKGDTIQRPQIQQQGHKVSSEIDLSKEAPPVDITDSKPNEQLFRRSLYLQKFIGQNSSPEGMNAAMYTPILPGTMQIFEAHIYSTMTEKEYFFWLDMGKEMRVLMKARKFARPNRSEFQLMTYYPQKKMYTQSCKMVSNFDRTRFMVSREERANGKTRMLGTITTSTSINNSKTLVLYYPKVNQRNQPTIFYQQTEDKDLQLVYRQNKIHEVDFIMTAKMETHKRLQIMARHELRTSQKSMEFKNYNGDIRMIIGKKGSKRYKIIVGPGLTPAQVFALLIAQVET